MVGLAKKGGLNWLYKTFWKQKTHFLLINQTMKSKSKSYKIVHFQLIKNKNNRLIISYTMNQLISSLKQHAFLINIRSNQYI